MAAKSKNNYSLVNWGPRNGSRRMAISEEDGMLVQLRYVKKGVRAHIMSQHLIKYLLIGYHPTILQPKEILETPSYFCIVQEFEGESTLCLSSLLVFRPKFDEDTARVYFHDIMCTVEFIHQYGIYGLRLDLSRFHRLYLDTSAVPRQKKRVEQKFSYNLDCRVSVSDKDDGEAQDFKALGTMLYMMLVGLGKHAVDAADISRHGFHPALESLLCRLLFSHDEAKQDPNTSPVSMNEILSNEWFREGCPYCIKTMNTQIKKRNAEFKKAHAPFPAS